VKVQSTGQNFAARAPHPPKPLNENRRRWFSAPSSIEGGIVSHFSGTIREDLSRQIQSLDIHESAIDRVLDVTTAEPCVNYLRREHGHLHAEVDVQCTWAGAAHHGGSLSCADQNLSSQAARKTLAKHCAERARTKAEDFDWLKAIDGACPETIRAERYGEDPIVLDDAADDVEQDHNVFGISVPADATSMLIAHGDSLKSPLLLFVLGNLALAGYKVLFVDWEWTAARHKGRKRKLFGTDRIPGLFYLRCHAPLTIEVDRIRRFAEANGVTFFGIDSVGLAADGMKGRGR
jgi:hypothetical protein